jgi:monofunctional biosynthetic peptidoglycan transglycosylase
VKLPAGLAPGRLWRGYVRRHWLLKALIAGIGLTLLLVLPFRWLPPPGSAFMAQRYLTALQDGQSDYRWRHQWTPWARISPWAPLAVLASEDQRFPDHRGFDFQAMVNAVEERLDGRPLRGASTLSQQVAKNLYLWSGRNLFRKGLEAYFTLLIEVFWPKRRILEIYLNVAEFGDGIYGIEAASRAFFQKPAARLAPWEAARLVAVLPSPRRWNPARPTPYVRQRAEWIARQMRLMGGTAFLKRLDR